MQSILITGGAGFIGSTIIKHFKDLGYDNLYVIDNLSFGKRELVDLPDKNFFDVDIRNREQLHTVMNKVKPQKVIHLAAIHFIPYCNKHPFEATDVNVNGTINLLEVLKDQPQLETLFFASTAAVYPIMDGPIAEDQPQSPLDIYGLSKLSGEYIVKDFHQRTGIPTIICRFFNAFGPNETNPHLIPEIQKQINDGIRRIKLGNLEPKRDFIHTEDMAIAVRLLMENFRSGIDIFNLGSGQEFSVRDIVVAFRNVLGSPIEIEQDPLRMRKSDRMHLLADISKIKNFLDWEPRISIEEGIETLVNIADKPMYE